MARDIDRVMRMIVDAKTLDDLLMRDVDMLLQGLTYVEKLNIVNVAMRDWQNRNGVSLEEDLAAQAAQGA